VFADGADLRFGLRQFFLRRLRRDGLRICNGHDVRHQQGDEPDIGAAADALQHHAADVDRGDDRAHLQRFLARIIEAGIDEVLKTEQGTRHIVGADQSARRRKRRNRHREAFDQMLQAFFQRHDAAGGLAWCDENAVAAIGEIEPRTAAGRQHTRRGAKTLQAFQPDRAVRKQAAGKACDLSPMLIGRSENPARQGAAVVG